MENFNDGGKQGEFAGNLILGFVALVIVAVIIEHIYKFIFS